MMLSSRTLLFPLAIHLAPLAVNQEEDQLRSSVGAVQKFLKIKMRTLKMMRILKMMRNMKMNIVVGNIFHSLLSGPLNDMKIAGYVDSLKRMETLETCMTTMSTAILQDVLAMSR